MNYDVKDLSLSKAGKLKIEWAGQQMPVLQLIKERFAKEKPLKNIRLGVCLHVTSETANLMLALKAGGAEVTLCASNPLSTQDSVAASLVHDYKIPVLAIKGEDTQTYFRHLKTVLAVKPQVTMDDGADLVSLLHQKYPAQIKSVIGSSEETTTGVIRLKAMAKVGALKLPVIAVNDSDTKHLFDNHYGTGQSTIDGILRATNILLAGKVFVVVGYGNCGKGLAIRARGMGANVVVVEVDSVRALAAGMDGFRAMTMTEAAKIGDIFVTVTGDKNAIDLKHLRLMKDGAILANSGHFDCEINVAALKKLTPKPRTIRPFLEEYVLGKKKLYLLGEGRLVNLAAAEGHPAEVMDLSFADQALSAEYLVKNKGRLKPQVYTLPEKLDKEVARLKLKAMGWGLEKLTKEQQKYLSSWEEGTE
jgi:adenosylhomocysteinase